MSSTTKTILLSSAYLPDLTYLSEVLNADTIYIEQQEHFVKQTHRNRCDILTSNGKLTLSIPLLKSGEKELISNKRISYAENWQQQHWRSITSAYKSSPYFEFFEDEFKPFYNTKFDLLIDFNTQLLQTVLHILRIKKEILFTREFILNPIDCKDLREHPHSSLHEKLNQTPYYQIFADKLGFIPQVSCMDALFNVGLETIDLCKIK
jgi:hypothetical protein